MRSKKQVSSSNTARDSPLPRGSACLGCRSRRVKCDGGLPACKACIRHARFHGQADERLCECVYSPSTPRAEARSAAIAAASRVRRGGVEAEARGGVVLLSAKDGFEGLEEFLDEQSQRKQQLLGPPRTTTLPPLTRLRMEDDVAGQHLLPYESDAPRLNTAISQVSSHVPGLDACSEAGSSPTESPLEPVEYIGQPFVHMHHYHQQYQHHAPNHVTPSPFYYWTEATPSTSMAVYQSREPVAWVQQPPYEYETSCTRGYPTTTPHVYITTPSPSAQQQYEATRPVSQAGSDPGSLATSPVSPQQTSAVEEARVEWMEGAVRPYADVSSPLVLSTPPIPFPRVATAESFHVPVSTPSRAAFAVTAIESQQPTGWKEDWVPAA
ncbi:hypothetical protein T439DRAFT_358613 [Meredithblackwellia eburnea MCA 4105]